jgi:uncharacterized YigZ family protein
VTVDAYCVPARAARSATRVSGSRFHAFAEPVETVDQALARWKSLKEEFFDATHHCYAYRIGPDGGEFRWNDDGEPAGSAGKPLLAAIDHTGLVNVVVVVVRYFGGTKLGVGGLVRAYGEAAKAALDAAGKEERFLTVPIAIGFAHEHTSAVMRVLQSSGSTVMTSHYDDRAHLSVLVRASAVARVKEELVNGTNGAIRFETSTP